MSSPGRVAAPEDSQLARVTKVPAEVGLPCRGRCRCASGGVLFVKALKADYEYSLITNALHLLPLSASAHLRAISCLLVRPAPHSKYFVRPAGFVWQDATACTVLDGRRSPGGCGQEPWCLSPLVSLHWDAAVTISFFACAVMHWSKNA